MGYLCKKMLSIGGSFYCPGNVIPDGVIFPERSGKLLKSGHIAEINQEELNLPEINAGLKLQCVSIQEKMFSENEVKAMIADAVAETEKGYAEKFTELRGYTAELQETEMGAYEGTILISVKSASDRENERIASISVKPEEIQQAFSILQMNAEEGVKMIADVTSENVLILLHAADSRKTIKNAAKERADKLFSTEEVPNESGNGFTRANIKEVDA